MKRILAVFALLLGALWLVTLLFDADRLRPRVQVALEQALHRRVAVKGKVEYKWLTGAGLQAADVEIAEDPSLGLEPMAYVALLEATPRWPALLRGRIEFSSLRLVEPSLNVLRTAGGQLNIQPFLEGLFAARDVQANLPEIEVRGGRLNFTQGIRKSIVYLTATDLDLRPVESRGFQIALATQIARTDRAPMGYGSFTAQGRLRFLPEAEPELDLTLDLERTAPADFMLLFQGTRGDIGGRISARTKLAGPLSRLSLNGRLDLEGFQRWNIPGWSPGALTLFFAGEADLRGQSVQLATVADRKPALPVKVRFRSVQMFSRPRWGLVAAIDNLPAAALSDAAKLAGIRLPEELPVSSTAEGAIGISASEPTLRGGLRFLDATGEVKRFLLPQLMPEAAVARDPLSR
jgi:hypothetical protein